MTFDAFIAKFPDAKKSGTNWIAKCPAHDDQNPSLAISEGQRGRILIKCHAGCATDNVVAAIGLTMKDLTPATKPASRREVARYTYTDESGNPLYTVIRYHPKTFRQQAADGTWNVKGIHKVPYKLPELIRAVNDRQTIYIVEGEKDVEALQNIRLTATCNAGGAGKWEKGWSSHFNGADVVIIADKDKPGRDHAKNVASALFGHATSIRVIELPAINGEAVKDSADYLNAGGTVEGILSVCKSTKPWEPSTTDAPATLEATSEVAPAHTPLFYESGKGAWWTQNDRGIYITVNETHVERSLKARGFSNSNARDELSEVALEILRHQKTLDVDYAGPLAGWNSGLHVVNNSRILVTASTLPTVATPIPFSRLLQAIIGILGEEQSNWLFYWLKVRRMAVLRQEWRPGQAVFFAGPPHSGKSYIQWLITELVGGRGVKPWQAMSGQTNFNGELFGGEHLCIEDELPDHRMQTRQKLGASIKSYLFAKSVLCHAKNRQGISLEPRWTMTVSLNDEPENLQIIPPLDESLRDKITLLKCDRNPRPVPKGMDEKQWLTSIANQELPGLAYHIDQLEIPQAWHEPRTLVQSYHHPDILAELEVASPELQLLDLIQKVYFRSDSESPFIIVSALELETELREKFFGIASTLLRSHSTCSTYLSRLANSRPDLVERKRQNTGNKWIIRRA